MLFFYIRHGDPIYEPDSLTPLGQRQAEAVAKRLSVHGLDRIYASTSQRAIDTARPTCEILKKDMELVDFINEDHAWWNLTVEADTGELIWPFFDPRTKPLAADPKMRALGFEWYKHPAFEKYDFEKWANWYYDETDKFFASLGYEHERYTGRYKVTKPNNERVAMFAHHCSGLTFLSCLLDIPFPMVNTHLDMTHTGVTVIEFKEEFGYAQPRISMLSSDAHLYREGLTTNYKNFFII